MCVTRIAEKFITISNWQHYAISGLDALLGQRAAANNAGRGLGSASPFDKPSNTRQDTKSPKGRLASQGSQGITDGVTDPRLLDAIMSKLAVVKKTLDKQKSATKEPKTKPQGRFSNQGKWRIFYPYLPNGLFHPYQLVGSISKFSGV